MRRSTRRSRDAAPACYGDDTLFDPNPRILPPSRASSAPPQHRPTAPRSARVRRHGGTAPDSSCSQAPSSPPHRRPVRDRPARRRGVRTSAAPSCAADACRPPAKPAGPDRDHVRSSPRTDEPLLAAVRTDTLGDQSARRRTSCPTRRTVPAKSTRLRAEAIPAPGRIPR